MDARIKSVAGPVTAKNSECDEQAKLSCGPPQLQRPGPGYRPELFSFAPL